VLKSSQYNSAVFTRLLQPLSDLLEGCVHSRNCPALPDSQWLANGVSRVLLPVASGRNFLQSLLNHDLTELPLSTFFDSLKSPRRARLLGELLQRVNTHARGRIPDPLARFPELDAFDCHVGDGHFVAAAAHDARRGAGNTKHATGHLFTLNLRSRCLNHLTVGDQVHRKKEHDMRALKRQTLEDLRQGAPAGRKVMLIWDKAGIDFTQWHKWKQGGLYFLSLEKDNMRLTVSGLPPWERDAPINRGIESVELVGASAGTMLRRIRYRCPERDEVFVFLTNEMNLSPGLIAFLYRLRWDIEKVFDETKNRFFERQSWANTATAKTNQARFMCLAYNLTILMEHALAREEGIENRPEQQRQARRREEVLDRVARQGAAMPSWYETLERFTQRGVKLLRWLSNLVFANVPWDRALNALRRHYRRL